MHIVKFFVFALFSDSLEIVHVQGVQPICAFLTCLALILCMVLVISESSLHILKFINLYQLISLISSNNVCKLKIEALRLVIQFA